MQSEISQDAAKQQLDKYLDFFDLEIDELKAEQQNDVVKNSIDIAYTRILKATARGKLEFSFDDDSAQIIQHVGRDENKTDLTYKELTGAAKVAMKEGSSEYERMYALVGNLTGAGLAGIKKLSGRDLSLVECIALLLLQI